MATAHKSRASGDVLNVLDNYIDHYENQKIKWMRYYYGSKAVTILLAAAIPVMTTVKAWPWTVAIVGSCIVALEGISQLWHFHDRYVASRVLFKALEGEQILFYAKVGVYVKDDEVAAKKRLASRISENLNRYESEVLSALRDEPGTAGGAEATKTQADQTDASAEAAKT